MKYIYTRKDPDGSENLSLEDQMKKVLAGGDASMPNIITTDDPDLNLQEMMNHAAEHGIDTVVIKSIDRFDNLKLPLTYYRKAFHDAGITVTFSDEHSQAVWDSTSFLPNP